MDRRFLEVPRLRVWHLIGLVAVSAAYLAVFRFRSDTYAPLSRTVRLARLGGVADRRVAVRELAVEPPGSAGVVDALLGALDDPDLEVRRDATRSLGQVLSTGRTPSPTDRRAPEAQARLRAQLGDEDLELRVRSALALARLEDRSERVRDVLIEATQQPGPNERREAIFVLATHFEDDPVTAAVRAVFDDADPEMRAAALYAMGNRLASRRLLHAADVLNDGSTTQPGADLEQEKGRTASTTPGPVLRGVIARLDDPSPHVRTAAATALGYTGKGARLALPALVRHLHDESAETRTCVVRALRHLSAACEPALPALREVAEHDADSTVREHAAAAVSGVEAELKQLREVALPALIEELSDDAAPRRRAAALELGAVGPPARAAVPALRTRLSDPDAKVRRAAEAALREIDRQDSEVPEPHQPGSSPR